MQETKTEALTDFNKYAFPVSYLKLKKDNKFTLPSISQ